MADKVARTCSHAPWQPYHIVKFNPSERIENILFFCVPRTTMGCGGSCDFYRGNKSQWIFRCSLSHLVIVSCVVVVFFHQCVVVSAKGDNVHHPENKSILHFITIGLLFTGLISRSCCSHLIRRIDLFLVRKLYPSSKKGQIQSFLPRKN